MTTIVVVHPDPTARAQWVAALGARLPNARILAEDPSDTAGTAPRHEACWAVGWQPGADFFARHPQLQGFFSAGAGVDHLLQHPGLPASLPVFRLEDAGMGRQMADYCLHAVLRAFLDVPTYEARQTRREWADEAPRDRRDWTVGILGLGQLGRGVAQALAAQDFPVLGFTRTPPRESAPCEVLCGDAQWPDFLARSRVLVLLAPLTPQTRGMVDARALATLPRGAWLINMARGALIDETALREALDCGQLAGAALDVFATEPLPPGHAFWQHPGIRITPHVAAATLVGPGADQVAARIPALERGEPVFGQVDRARGY